MTAIHVPPINLLNISSAMFLLLSYPLLAKVDGRNTIDAATTLWYNKSASSHSGASLNAHREV